MKGIIPSLKKLFKFRSKNPCSSIPSFASFPYFIPVQSPDVISKLIVERKWSAVTTGPSRSVMSARDRFAGRASDEWKSREWPRERPGWLGWCQNERRADMRDRGWSVDSPGIVGSSGLLAQRLREIVVEIILLEACARASTRVPWKREKDAEAGKRTANLRRTAEKKRKEIAKWKVAGHRYWPAENAPPRGAICKRRFKTGYLRFARSPPDSHAHERAKLWLMRVTAVLLFSSFTHLADAGPDAWAWHGGVDEKKIVKHRPAGHATCNQSGTKGRKQDGRATGWLGFTFNRDRPLASYRP